MTGRRAMALPAVWVLLAAAAPPENVAVVVLDRAVEAGDVLSGDDLLTVPLAAGTARGALRVRDIAGMEAVRRLAAGSIIRAADIVRPQLVRRGEPVAITVRSGSMVISTTGRALASGAAGAQVRVVTASTSRTLDGVVEGPGAVRVLAN